MELMNQRSVRRGMQALDNHYSSPSSARAFKKVEAKGRTSTTKTGRVHSSSLYRSNSIARPDNNQKYRSSDDQKSEEVDVAAWLDAFRVLDVYRSGSLDVTHVQLLLARVHRSIPSESVTDWVNRVGRNVSNGGGEGGGEGGGRRRRKGGGGAAAARTVHLMPRHYAFGSRASHATHTLRNTFTQSSRQGTD